MNRLKKMFAAFLMVALTLALLAGCGPAENGAVETSNGLEGEESIGSAQDAGDKSAENETLEPDQEIAFSNEEPEENELPGSAQVGSEAKKGESVGATQKETAEESKKEEPAKSAWEIIITGPSTEKTIALETIKAMPAVTLETVKKGETNEYTGAVLSAVLKEAGITGATEVTFEAADGYATKLSGEVAFSDNTILAYLEDGAEMSAKSAPVMLVTTDDKPKSWVGQLISIAVK